MLCSVALQSCARGSVGAAQLWRATLRAHISRDIKLPAQHAVSISAPFNFRAQGCAAFHHQLTAQQKTPCLSPPSPQSQAARSLTAAAIRPSKPTCISPAAPSGRAAVPSGASTGEHEAWELRDGVKDRYLGKGVLKAVANVNKTIADELEGLDALDQVAVDRAMIELDGTQNKAKLGANAILAVSLATAKAAAAQLGHAALQIPRRAERQGAARADDEHHQRRRALGCADRFPGIHGRCRRAATLSARRCAAGAEIFHALKSVLKGRGLAHRGRRRRRLRAEPRRAPTTRSRRSPQAVKNAGYKVGKDIFLALDVAASEFYDKAKKQYVFKKSNGRSVQRATNSSPSTQSSAQKFPIISIEDGCAENDWDGWKKLTDALGDNDAARRRRSLRDQRRVPPARASRPARRIRFS